MTFIFNPESHGVNPDGMDCVYVIGTFTGWLTSPEWALEPSEHGRSLRARADSVLIPGSSGFAEFKFKVFMNDGTVIEPDLSAYGPSFTGNALLLFKPLTRGQRKELSRAQNITRSPASTRGKERMANVRAVPGTTGLFRGYHPYKKSRPQLETESARLQEVNRFIERHGVKSIITLSGDEIPDPALGEEISPYVRKIREAGNQCLIDTSYEIMYFKSADKEYDSVIRQAVRFINAHPAPFYVHCRIGSDRTGVMSAVLAALCGASWKKIAEDYEKTSDAGFMEYRNRNLLAYSLSRVLGSHPGDCGKSLRDKMRSKLSERGIATLRELDDLERKLNPGRKTAS